jgi:uncharacterized Zn finger protein
MEWTYKCKQCGEEFEVDSACCGRDTQITCMNCGVENAEEVPLKNENDFRRMLSRFMNYGGG